MTVRSFEQMITNPEGMAEFEVFMANEVQHLHAATVRELARVKFLLATHVGHPSDFLGEIDMSWQVSYGNYTMNAGDWEDAFSEEQYIDLAERRGEVCNLLVSEAGFFSFVDESNLVEWAINYIGNPDVPDLDDALEVIHSFLGGFNPDTGDYISIRLVAGNAYSYSDVHSEWLVNRMADLTHMFIDSPHCDRERIQSVPMESILI